MILYSIKQIPDQSNAQKNKQVRLEGELHWIKTLGTQFLHGMNHKILSKHDVVITFPFSSNAINAFKITKNICTKLQAMYPNIYKAELMCSFKCNRNTYENLNLRALKNLTLCKNIRIFLDVLKSELCSFFALQLLLIVHVTMVTKPYFCHHYWQMITHDILWACCEKSISSLSTYWVIQISHNWTDVLFFYTR